MFLLDVLDDYCVRPTRSIQNYSLHRQFYLSSIRDILSSNFKRFLNVVCTVVNDKRTELAAGSMPTPSAMTSTSNLKKLKTATSPTAAAATTSTTHRQASLDRDVFYFDNDRREEVVKYKPFAIGSAAKKFGMNPEEESVYKSSMANLCSQELML